MRILKHIFEQPFITATGAAALLHSTWSLGTLFAGEQPEGWHLLGWIIPALLIAFALDVGQIATSAEIRTHGLTKSRGMTFIVFALATYYLQWLYMAHHMPALALAPGVRASWSDGARLLRDAAVWLIPALLPLSTLLYTFSGQQRPESQPAPVVVAVPAAEPQITIASAERPQLAEPLTDRNIAVCPACGWTKTYDNPVSAARGLATHQAKHCPAIHLQIEQRTNGKSVTVQSNDNGEL